MITVIGSNKGGASKSTTATNVAIALALRGKDVCLLDADLQSSAAKWHASREEYDLQPRITLIQKYGNISQTLRQLDEKFDHVIVDVAGRNSRELANAGAVADIIIAPHLCSQFDLDTLEELESQLEAWKDLNPDLVLYMYQTRATTNPVLRGKERAEFLTYLEDFPTLSPLNAINCERKIYRDVVPLGKSVLEATNNTAIDEVNQLIEEVYAQWL
ncbi:division plane positioning ATPase MipZ [Ewingella sp. CoE-038-23]|jgi:ATPases involved in chromosome partitioning|uniref:division plane positioning ATPase MipZ n=1 Tax=Ewingella docleensis TaxID=3118588 RepID=UPI0033659860